MIGSRTIDACFKGITSGTGRQWISPKIGAGEMLKESPYRADTLCMSTYTITFANGTTQAWGETTRNVITKWCERNLAMEDVQYYCTDDQTGEVVSAYMDRV